ncbi:MAG TPA: hypothetical protein VHV75_14945 [Solirubrobacteraceae bacterium]|nr:hypothetical protein [Solirubrobacteraceae bacterium]
MSYPRQNTVQTGAVGSAADTSASCALPNTETELPGDQVNAPNAITATQRWRIKGIVASYTATPATPGQLVITDGVFTWTIDVTAVLPLLPLDIQCAAGAEVDITLSAATGAIGHINVTAEVEG